MPQPGLCQAKARSWDHNPDFPQDPRAWIIFCCLPGCWNQEHSQDLNSLTSTSDVGFPSDVWITMPDALAMIVYKQESSHTWIRWLTLAAVWIMNLRSEFKTLILLIADLLLKCFSSIQYINYLCLNIYIFIFWSSLAYLLPYIVYFHIHNIKKTHNNVHLKLLNVNMMSVFSSHSGKDHLYTP